MTTDPTAIRVPSMPSAETIKRARGTGSYGAMLVEERIGEVAAAEQDKWRAEVAAASNPRYEPPPVMAALRTAEHEAETAKRARIADLLNRFFLHEQAHEGPGLDKAETVELAAALRLFNVTTDEGLNAVRSAWSERRQHEAALPPARAACADLRDDDAIHADMRAVNAEREKVLRPLQEREDRLVAELHRGKTRRERVLAHERAIAALRIDSAGALLAPVGAVLPEWMRTHGTQRAGASAVSGVFVPRAPAGI